MLQMGCAGKRCIATRRQFSLRDDVAEAQRRQGMQSTTRALSHPFTDLAKQFLSNYCATLFTNSRKFSLLVSVVVDECTDMHLKNLDDLRPLGNGSFGVVTLVRSKKTGALFALKRIDKLQVIQRHRGISTMQLLDESCHEACGTLKFCNQTPLRLV